MRSSLQQGPATTPANYVPDASIRENETTIKIKFALFRGGGWGWAGGREENCPKRYFHGKRHDNKILKVKILLSRSFVVMAQAPILENGRDCLKFSAGGVGMRCLAQKGCSI